MTNGQHRYYATPDLASRWYTMWTVQDRRTGRTVAEYRLEHQAAQRAAALNNKINQHNQRDRE